MAILNGSKKIRICEFIINNFPDKPFTFLDLELDGIEASTAHSSLKRMNERDNLLFRDGYMINPRTNRNVIVYRVRDLPALKEYRDTGGEHHIPMQVKDKRVRQTKIYPPIRKCPKHIARMLAADRLAAALRIPFISVAAL